MATVVRRTVRARDIPPSWNVHLPGDPDAPITVVIMPGGDDAGDVRPLTSFLGAGKGVFGSPEKGRPVHPGKPLHGRSSGAQF